MFAAIKKFFCIFIVVCLLSLGLLAGCSKENAEAPEEPKKILEIATSLSGLKGSPGLDADEKALRSNIKTFWTLATNSTGFTIQIIWEMLTPI